MYQINDHYVILNLKDEPSDYYPAWKISYHYLITVDRRSNLMKNIKKDFLKESDSD